MGPVTKHLKVLVNMTSIVNKICTNIQTSMGCYLLKSVLASMCTCSQKSWILFTVPTCKLVVHSFKIIYQQQGLCCLLPQVFSLACMAGRILFDTILTEI